MISFILKPNPIRIGWYTLDDIQGNSLESLRMRIAMRPHSWRPPTDVFETEDAVVVRVEMSIIKSTNALCFLLSAGNKARWWVCVPDATPTWENLMLSR